MSEYKETFNAAVLRARRQNRGQVIAQKMMENSEKAKELKK